MSLKTALAHDHLTQFGGAEQVLVELKRILPESILYTLIYDPKAFGSLFADWKIKTSFLQNWPGNPRLFKWYLSLMPAAVENLDVGEVDVLVSSSSALIKGIITKPETVHICYCHTPTRYLWSDTHKYTEDLEQPRLVKKLLPFVLTKLRTWDQLAAKRVDYFIANSNYVAQRIKKYYRREAEIIYPPVPTDKYHASEDIEDYYLVVSRLRPYKRVDVAIKAFNKLGIPLKIIGIGEQYADLAKIAKSNIEFLGAVTEQEKALYLSKAKALIFPQEEDFGITAVESLASGRPIIAYDKGGAREIIEAGINGEFFSEQTWEALADKVIRFKPKAYDTEAILGSAARFDSKVFREKIDEFISRSQKA